MTAETLYGADDLTHLEGLEAVRKRPGMYIGSTDSRGINHLFSEVVDNSTDEGVAGHATKVVVTCAHCLNTRKNEYPQLGLSLEVVHHTQLLNRLVR